MDFLKLHISIVMYFVTVILLCLNEVWVVSYEIIKTLFHDFQDVENGTSDTLDMAKFSLVVNGSIIYTHTVA